MNWYYTREPGSQGQILNDEGNPPGTPLSKLLQHGVLPIGVALEVIACLAEILTIAEEDNAVHGDIKPGDVFVAANGSVSRRQLRVIPGQLVVSTASALIHLRRAGAHAGQWHSKCSGVSGTWRSQYGHRPLSTLPAAQR